MSEENNSAKKSLMILDLFLKNEKLGIKEIIDSTGYSKSAIHRIMSTLESANYIYKNTDENKYFLSSKLYFLGEKTNINRHIVHACKDPVEELSQKLRLTISVSIMEDNMCVVVYKKDSQQNMGLVPNVGERRHLHCSASGKVLTGFSTDKERIIDSLRYEKLTPNTIHTKECFIHAVNKAMIEGFAYDDEELAAGLFCIATPVLDINKKAICSLSISGYKVKMLENLDTIKKELKETADKIGNLMN